MAYDHNNIFARILRGEAPAFKVYEDDTTVAILDVMPQADGHTLVLPRTPAQNLFELDDAAAADVMRTTRTIARAVHAAFGADGIRVMQFNGPAAGQTVFHFHMHVIPCHDGLPLRGHGRSMAEPQVLAEHARRLRVALGDTV